MRKPVESRIRNLVIRYRRKSPHMGLRGISSLIKAKHALSVSKSSINNILKTYHMSCDRGRKRHLLLYRRRPVQGCALLLLRCMDQEVGLLENARNELKVYFPKIAPRLLEKIILFLSLNAYLKRNAKDISAYKEFLKIADLYFFPARTLAYFLQKVATYAPVIQLAETRDNLQQVSTLKFYFGNGYHGHCDATMTTFWDDPCYVDNFFSSLHAAKARLQFIERHNFIYIYYTKSFDQFSPLAIDFLRSIPTGIKKIEILSPKGHVVFKKEFSSLKPSFFIGYYPRIISKGFAFLEKGDRFKKLALPPGDVLYSTVITRFIHPKSKVATITNNVLLKRKKKTLPTWGILTDKKSNISGYLRQYLLLWPSMEKSFLEQMKTIEASYFAERRDTGLQALVPSALSLAKEEDFSKITDILAKIFVERFGKLDFSLSGEYTVNKESCSVVLGRIDPRLKEKFNSACLSVRDKRAFLL